MKNETCANFKKEYIEFGLCEICIKDHCLKTKEIHSEGEFYVLCTEKDSKKLFECYDAYTGDGKEACAEKVKEWKKEGEDLVKKNKDVPKCSGNQIKNMSISSLLFLSCCASFYWMIMFQ